MALVSLLERDVPVDPTVSVGLTVEDVVAVDVS